MEKKQIIADKSAERLDVFLQAKLEKYTRSKIKNWLEEKLILVNSKIEKAGYKVVIGDLIEVNIPEEKTLNAEPEKIDIDIVYEDDDLVVVNKPQGMVVHPAVGNFTGTLVNALCYKIKNLSDINGEFRPGIVHRIDKDTSGLLIVAKNNVAHENLAKQIQTKECKRSYYAILEGNLDEDEGVVETYIGRSLKDRRKMCVCDSGKGKIAITEYKVLNRYAGYCLVEFKLKTGRTHQIRVHAKHLGHPVVGDNVYGFKNKYPFLKGQLLHAYKLEFSQPTTKEKIVVKCDIPDYFENFLKKLT